MIGKIKGVVSDYQNGELIIDVNGVGYLVFVPASYFLNINETIDLCIETVVKEDSISLFGFLTNTEKMFFKKLRSVSGVGPKTALLVLSFYKVEELRNLILEQNVSMMSKVPGIGKKTAERIIVELKDKTASLISIDNLSKYDEIILALTNLGYKKSEASSLLEKKRDYFTKGFSQEEILRNLLKSMVK
jgi:Holliday junction DNA helicase RuvA